MAWRYRKYIDIKLVAPMTPIYALVFFLSLRVAVRIDTQSLKAYFGLSLIVLAMYSVFFSDKIKMKKGLLTAVICAALSGALSAFFGIGGPPMALYLLALSGDCKEKYIANSQCLFAVNSIFASGIRIMNGLLSPELYPLLLTGAAALILGRCIGIKVLDKLNIVKMKKIIACVLVFSGIHTFLANI